MPPDDDDWPERIELDPRWEVPPEPLEDDGSGSALRTIGVAVLGLVVFAAILVWFVSIAPPAT